MFSINLYNFINSIDLTLEKNIKSYNDSFVNNFIDELKNHLVAADSIQKFSKLPDNTLFTLDRYEGDFAICENRSTGEMYDIPKLMIDSSAKNGDILQFDGTKFLINSLETKKERKIIHNLVENISKLNKDLK